MPRKDQNGEAATSDVDPVESQNSAIDESAPSAVTEAYGSDAYLPGFALSQRAVPISSILLRYPEFPGDVGAYVAVVELFIDEDGAVQRIRIEAPGLPEALEAAVRQAFLPTRFEPAQVDGFPARELKRVEVRFDRGPPETP